MTKILGLFNALTLYLFTSPALAFATHEAGKAHTTIAVCPPGQFAPLCELTAGTFGKSLGTIVTFAFVGAILIALAFLIWGGIKWISSGGDKTSLEEARNHIIAAIVGLVIVFLVYFILNLVVFFFTGTNIFSLELPSLAPAVNRNP